MPRVTEIVVSAGRTFNHPFESYSNLKPSLTLKAELVDGEDWEEVVKGMQAQAERLIEDHKRHLLKSLEEIEELNRKAQRVASLESKIRDAQSELDRLRGGLAELPALGVSDAGEDDDRAF